MRDQTSNGMEMKYVFVFSLFLPCMILHNDYETFFLISPRVPKHKWISVSAANKRDRCTTLDCSEIIQYSCFVVLCWNLTPNWRKFDIKFFRSDSYSIKDTAECWQDWQDTTPLTEGPVHQFSSSSFLPTFISARHIIICCKHQPWALAGDFDYTLRHFIRLEEASFN